MRCRSPRPAPEHLRYAGSCRHFRGPAAGAARHSCRRYGSAPKAPADPVSDRRRTRPGCVLSGTVPPPDCPRQERSVCRAARPANPLPASVPDRPLSRTAVSAPHRFSRHPTPAESPPAQTIRSLSVPSGNVPACGTVSPQHYHAPKFSAAFPYRFPPAFVMAAPCRAVRRTLSGTAEYSGFSS